jgi:Gpi18-like mannosyltransferase
VTALRKVPVPPLWATAAAALILYALLWPLTSHDMDVYLLPWLHHIRAHGPVGAFAIPFSNYNPPYLYLLSAASTLGGALPEVTAIKLLSVAGTLWLAFAVHRLLQASGAPTRPRDAALLILVPSVMANAAMLGQADAWWTATCAMALAEAARRRPVPMLVWCGIAAAFKAQAAFFAPFALAWLISERVPLKLWPIPAGAYLALLLPAWLAGWPAADLATIYLRQAETNHAISLNAPNIWMLAEGFAPIDSTLAIAAAFAAAALAAAGYVILLARRRLDGRALLTAALLSSLVLPGLLPRMHERFFFLADILSFALVTAARDRQSLLIFGAVQTASAMALFAYVTADPNWARIAAVAMIAGTLATAAALFSAERQPAPAAPAQA